MTLPVTAYLTIESCLKCANGTILVPKKSVTGCHEYQGYNDGFFFVINTWKLLGRVTFGRILNRQAEFVLSASPPIRK